MTDEQDAENLALERLDEIDLTIFAIILRYFSQLLAAADVEARWKLVIMFHLIGDKA